MMGRVVLSDDERPKCVAAGRIVSTDEWRSGMALILDPEREMVDFFDKKKEKAALQRLLNDMVMIIEEGFTLPILSSWNPLEFLWICGVYVESMWIFL
jgi:hypothetical protein